MTDTNFCDVDMVKELRLRQWARKNYVHAAHRKNTWHPVVLEEMDDRDFEVETQVHTYSAGLGYVPLAPNVVHIVHAQHANIREPSFVRSFEAVDSFVSG